MVTNLRDPLNCGLVLEGEDTRGDVLDLSVECGVDFLELLILPRDCLVPDTVHTQVLTWGSWLYLVAGWLRSQVLTVYSNTSVLATGTHTFWLSC